MHRVYADVQFSSFNRKWALRGRKFETDQKVDRTIEKCFLMMPSQYNGRDVGPLTALSHEPQQCSEWGWLKKSSEKSKG